jgi:hypothetical protein
MEGHVSTTQLPDQRKQLMWLLYGSEDKTSSVHYLSELAGTVERNVWLLYGSEDWIFQD